MPESTSRGYPVPVLGDAVDDGAGHLNAFWDLALAIDADMTASIGVSILDRVHSTLTVVNTVTESDLYRKTIPGGTLGVDGAVRLSMGLDLLNDTGTARVYRFRVKYGATTVLDSGTGWMDVPANANRHRLMFDLLLEADTAAAQRATAQLVRSDASATSFALVANTTQHFIGYGTAAEDSTAAKDLAVTVAIATASASADIRRQMAILEQIRHS